MKWSPLGIATIQVRRHAAPVIAAALIYSGIHQVVSTLKYRIGSLILRLVNQVIERGFRDRMLLPESWGAPWQFTAQSLAESVIAIVLGIFLGLWVHSRSQPQARKENPRRSEG